jgi:hypothetical protein
VCSGVFDEKRATFLRNPLFLITNLLGGTRIERVTNGLKDKSGIF